MNSVVRPRLLRRAGSWLRPTGGIVRTGRFLTYAVWRFWVDDCLRSAASLSYASLLALVPLLVIGLAMVSAFPAYDAFREQLQKLILENFMPETGVAVSQYVSRFVENASRLSGAGALGLGVVAVLLLANINDTLNAIWRVSEARPLARSLMVYWTLLTLGPLLVGSSVSFSSYAFAMIETAGIGGYADWLLRVSWFISFTLAALGFTLLYFVVPYRRVTLLHAAAGGIVAAALFESLKASFGLYLRLFPTYQAVYGALSAIPIFLVWMYLSWAVVLLGAEVAAALPEWRATQARGRHKAGPGDRLALALTLLSRLRQSSRAGTRLSERHLAAGLPATPTEIDATMQELRRANLVARTASGRWLLSRDLTMVSLGDLASILELGLDPVEHWPKLPRAIVNDLSAARSDALSTSLDQLLSEHSAKAEEAVRLTRIP